MSYLTQMFGLAVQNFVSAATGMAVLVALIRGFVRRESAVIGNFWVDLTRTTLYILLPLSLVLAVALVSQGVVQSFGLSHVPSSNRSRSSAHRWRRQPSQTRGRANAQKVTDADDCRSVRRRRQIAIKQLGTNGGGFFNVNSAHPFENPTPLSNFLELLAILLIPAALCFTFGRWSAIRGKAGRCSAAMLVLFVPLVSAARCGAGGNPLLTALASTSRLAPCSPAATWKGRKSASASPTRPCGPQPRRRRPTVPSTACMSPSRHSAGWCRWG